VTRVAVVHGPNLGRLGEREPAVYGAVTLDELNHALISWGKGHDVAVEAHQSNAEGSLIDFLEGGVGRLDGAVLNPGALAHYGLALRDCIAALPYPVVEVHLTNVFQRERFRHRLVLAPVVAGQITGMGPLGYRLALEALLERLSGGWPRLSGQNVQGEGGGRP
jgi:3-dehydroquinate dehydratase-2